MPDDVQANVSCSDIRILSRILIDKEGNMRAIVRYSDDLSAMIQDSL